ncbi:RNA polymerase sigma factor [Chitinophaga niabensis]|uniref:RNA polymerase sigma-70 factor, ECF subfamily n=1 Tax=Chitinophaga niabensis TaxID=536979 RepID=A0A1N6DDF9_9BACT|nr:sigma-70 family RNA polymerase sigma factor [Chitinophaga niabensis]SIN68821.1 RNA polymerase sigma-70 factor, ECF subfamily [Chitinophaga niabensis]
MQEFNQDKELFHLIAAGDEAAFRRLFHLHVPKLLPTVQHLTKNASVTEDILQEAFLKLWLSRDKLPGIEHPYSWLLKIVYYQCFSYLRHQAVHHKAMGIIAERRSENIMEDDMAFNMLMRTVGEAVQQLPPQAKRIYQLSRENGLKIPEIAQELHISPNTVKNSLVRSLQSIRQYIERAGHFLPLFILWYFF